MTNAEKRFAEKPPAVQTSATSASAVPSEHAYDFVRKQYYRSLLHQEEYDILYTEMILDVALKDNAITSKLIALEAQEREYSIVLKAINEIQVENEKDSSGDAIAR